MANIGNLHNANSIPNKTNKSEQSRSTTGSSPIPGKTQEKIDFKIKGRKAVHSEFADKEGKKFERDFADTPTMRGGFVSDGDVFGTGEDE